MEEGFSNVSLHYTMDSRQRAFNYEQDQVLEYDPPDVNPKLQMCADIKLKEGVNQKWRNPDLTR